MDTIIKFVSFLSISYPLSPFYYFIFSSFFSKFELIKYSDQNFRLLFLFGKSCKIIPRNIPLTQHLFIIFSMFSTSFLPRFFFYHVDKQALLFLPYSSPLSLLNLSIVVLFTPLLSPTRFQT